MKTSNPVLQIDTFSKNWSSARSDECMTVQGVVIKTGLLLILMTLSAAWTWNLFYKSGLSPSAVNLWILVGAIGGFGLAILTSLKQNLSPITAPLFAACEGLFIGGISAIFEGAFPGIVMQSAALTFGTLGAVLLAYQAGLLRVSETFKTILITATMGICFAYGITFLLRLLGIHISLFTGNGFGSIAFSLFVVGVAALNFVLDFDFIEKSAERRVAKYMEWYGAFALLVTLVWLYVEIVRLLSKLRSR